MAAFVVSVAFGALITLAGIGFRAGWWPSKSRRAKWYHTWYRNEAIPAFQRKNAGTALPMGLGFLLPALGIGLIEIGDSGVATAAGAVLIIAGVALLVAGIVMMFAGVPRFLQPRWLLEAERREAAGQPLDDLPMPPEGRQLVASRKQFALQIALVVAAVAVAAYFGYWTAAIVGLAFAIPIIVATRVRGRGDRGGGHPAH